MIRIRVRCAAAILFIVVKSSTSYVSPAFAGVQPQIEHEIDKLLPTSGEILARFGNSVAIDGDVAVVGARGATTYGPDSGAAYLFNTKTGELLSNLIPDDFDQFRVGAFGASVAINDRFALIGAPFSTTSLNADGAVYVYDVKTRLQLAKLTASTPTEAGRFGSSVAVQGSTAIIGALNGPLEGGLGTAHVFDLDPGEELIELQPDDNQIGIGFGYSVSVSNQIAIVSAPFDDDKGPRSGSAYLFDLISGDQVAKLQSTDGVQADRFGWSVDISDRFAIVGAPNHEFNSDKGAAYVFDSTTGNQLRKLIPHDPAPGYYFGESVAILDELAVIGAPQSDGRSRDEGAVYLFNARMGRELVKYIASDGTRFDNLGSAVDLSRTKVLAGAEDDDEFGNASGSAYLFAVSEPPIAAFGILVAFSLPFVSQVLKRGH
jgi:hypothetical protein